MSFKSLLDKYKDGNATAEEIKLIEEELNKHDAIEEYLSESYDIGFEKEPSREDIQNETSFVQKSVNKRLRKVILASVAIMFSILFTINYIVSPIVSRFYYNPSEKTVAKYFEDLFFDLRVITELNLPGYAINSAGSEKLGFGEYNIYFQRLNLFNRSRKDISAKIKRNDKIGNWQDFYVSDYLGFWDIREPNPTPTRDEITKMKNKEVISHIKELNPVSYISSYILFNEDMSVKQLDELITKYSNKVSFRWAGVRTESKDKTVYYLSGFNPNSNDGSSTEDSADKNKYPYLQLLDYMADEENRSKFNGSMEEAYTKHFISLLKYMTDREEAVKSLDYNGAKIGYYKNALNYVEKNGVNIYGVLVYGEARSLLEFIDNEKMKSIEIEGVLPSKYVN
jgi:hypothetical protein